MDEAREVWLRVRIPGLTRTTISSSSSAQTADSRLFRLDFLGVHSLFGGGDTIFLRPRPLGGTPVSGRTSARGTPASSTTIWLNWEYSRASSLLTRLLSLTNLPQFQALLASRTEIVPAMQERVFNPKKVAPITG